MSELKRDDAHAFVAEMVYNTVSNANEIVEGCDKLLQQKTPEGIPQEYFAIPRASMVTFREVLKTSSMIAAKLFEENQQIFDRVNQALEKAKGLPDGEKE